jgi:hypothetical protein
METNIPEIAVLGHPNEGKSSVLSTLAEDDSVRISPYPGETTTCRTFPVIIDGREILRFTDTPGFQNPGRLLAHYRSLTGSTEQKLRDLLAYAASATDLAEDHELLTPVARGAGIIYVVNGARPIRHVDRDEMELLRLIGKPRMAVINSKDEDSRSVDRWKDELAIHFNSIRRFNAHRAGYRERLALLEALKSIDQDWQQTFSGVIAVVEQNWNNRISASAHIITRFLTESLGLKLSAGLENAAAEHEVRARLTERYTSRIATLEKQAHDQIRGLFRHRRFDYRLPPRSILNEEIFSERSWQLLGLSKNQLILLGGLSGGAVGAGIDVAALGHGLGLFTALGAVGGALGALTGRKRLDYASSLLGIKISGARLTIGPAASISLLFVLINRSLHYFEHMANWSHGRRDYQELSQPPEDQSIANHTSDWPAAQLKLCNDFFRSAENPESEKHRAAAVDMETLLVKTLLAVVTQR